MSTSEEVTKTLEFAVESSLAESKGEFGRYSTKKFSKALAKRWFFSSSLKNFDLNEANGSYIVLFHKNASVTNLQFAELHSLIHRFAVVASGEDTRTTIMSSGKIESCIRGLAQSYELFSMNFSAVEGESAPREEVKEFSRSFVSNYSRLLMATVIVDHFFTSACIHIPLSVSINMVALIGASGYIHSAGPKLYIRNIDKCRERELTEAIEQVVEIGEGTKVFVVPYANEFFDNHDRYSTYSIRNGLDGLKFRLRKNFIEGGDFITYLDALRRSHPDKIRVYDGAEDFGTARRLSVEKYNCDDRWSIWITADRGLNVDHGELRLRPQEQKYLFAYLQCIKNGNEFLPFKERKPGWTAPITYPHTLSAALVNLCISEMGDTKGKKFLDPFCGTGTTLFDVTLRARDAFFLGLDRDEAMTRIIAVNFDFMSLGSNARKKLREWVGVFLRRIEDASESENSSFELQLLEKPVPPDVYRNVIGSEVTAEDVFRNALTIITTELYHACLEAITASDPSGTETSSQPVVVAGVSYLFNYGFSDDFWEHFDAQTQLFYKIALLLVWRGIANNQFEIRDDFSGVLNALKKELLAFSDETQQREAVRKLEHDSFEGTSEPWACAFDRNGFRVFQGTGLFSGVSGFSSDYISQRCKFEVVKNSDLAWQFDSNTTGRQIAICEVSDSLDALRGADNAFDAIICDPPYGFNTKEGGIEGLRSFYSNLMGTFVKCLRSNGQILMTVPLFAKNGKKIPFFATKEFLDFEFALACELNGKVAGRPSRVSGMRDEAPGEMGLYWCSTSALDRSVVWYKVL